MPHYFQLVDKSSFNSNDWLVGLFSLKFSITILQKYDLMKDTNTCPSTAELAKQSKDWCKQTGQSDDRKHNFTIITNNYSPLFLTNKYKTRHINLALKYINIG